MNTWATLLAAAMLTTPPDMPEVPPSEEDWPVLQAALHETAIAWEILDFRETRYILERVEDFDNDLNLLRRRYQRLKDAPPLAEVANWPDRSYVTDLMARNRQYRRDMDAQRTIFHADEALLSQVIKETDELYCIWDKVRDAQCEYYYITVRREALKALRCKLGRENFAERRLPPALPLWRMPEN